MKARRRPRNARPAPPAGRSAGLLDRALTWYSGQRVLVLFVVKFLVLLAALHALSLAPWFSRFLPIYLHSVTCGANGLAHLFGESSEVVGSTLRSTTFGVTVGPACSAIEFFWFIAAVVLAFPATWRARALGLLLGACMCALLNVVRVASLLFVGAHAHSIFDLAHEEIWSVLLVFFTTLFVAAWIHWLTGGDALVSGQANGCVSGCEGGLKVDL